MAVPTWEIDISGDGVPVVKQNGTAVSDVIAVKFAYEADAGFNGRAANTQFSLEVRVKDTAEETARLALLNHNPTIEQNAYQAEVNAQPPFKILRSRPGDTFEIISSANADVKTSGPVTL